jgi:hypothetical protein
MEQAEAFKGRGKALHVATIAAVTRADAYLRER